MKKLLIAIAVSTVFLFTSLTLSAQIEELFEKEEPLFQMTVLPLSEEGAVEIELYFTHSRLSNVEAAFWMIDRGNNRLNSGERQMIGELQQLNNRQQTVIKVDGLKAGHFYAFGLDYRRISALLNTKFSTKMLQEEYLYEPLPPITNAVAEEKVILPRKEFIAKATPTECDRPKLSIQIDPTGYCHDETTPAILISNAKNQDWEFSIETRGMSGDWRPMLAGGKRQKASGAITRTEPLCLLNSGRHFIRVLAWGEGCEAPTIKEIKMPIRIEGASTPDAFDQESLVTKSYTPPVAAYQPTLPDTCLVRGEAILVGNKLTGTIELDRYSLCGEFRPYAMVRYVNPSHRDIPLEPIPLYVGEPVDFEFELTDTDLTRTIHPVNVVTYVRTKEEEKIMSAFWIRSEQSSSITQNNMPIRPANQNSYAFTAPLNEPVDLTTAAPKPESERKPEFEPRPEIKELTIDEPTLTQQANAISVTASDPNCTQIHDLQMVYDLKRSKQPLYISWLSPRCCQEAGCEYTIWSGSAPDQLSLIMKGYKSGATIKELLDPNRAKDQYFEVVVKTKNGNRKAAYIIGEGAKYGIEEILAYHDNFNPVQSDSLKFEKIKGLDETPKGGATFKWDDPASNTAAIEYERPKLPISKFKTCKYRKPIELIADNPIHEGDLVTLKYDYDRVGYKYTLYFQPLGSNDWVVAPQTQELSSKAQFDFRVSSAHSGNYTMLLYKSEKGWGCLTAPLEEGLEILVIK